MDTFVDYNQDRNRIELDNRRIGRKVRVLDSEKWLEEMGIFFYTNVGWFKGMERHIQMHFYLILSSAEVIKS